MKATVARHADTAGPRQNADFTETLAARGAPAVWLRLFACSGRFRNSGGSVCEHPVSNTGQVWLAEKIWNRTHSSGHEQQEFGWIEIHMGWLRSACWQIRYETRASGHRPRPGAEPKVRTIKIVRPWEVSGRPPRTPVCWVEKMFALRVILPKVSKHFRC